MEKDNIMSLVQYCYLLLTFLAMHVNSFHLKCCFAHQRSNTQSPGEKIGPQHNVNSPLKGHSSNVKKLVYSSLILGCAMANSVESTLADDIDTVSKIKKPFLPETQEIIKRKVDKREYKAITLKNGMRVLLVSDRSINRAAAAIDVHVGSFSDPAELPGLAHFCEHMSFLGTKKYPQEEEFSSFLSSHGGSSNAYTDSEDTVYYFDVNSNEFEPALDRFAQFFVSPLFTPSATARELNAIESEHAKNINSDGFRLYQLERDSANPLHPLNKFATGNKFTLETNAIAQGINNREELLKFHEKYYSADQMTLALVSQQTLPQLEQWVKKYFEPVPNRHQKPGEVNPLQAKAFAPEKQWWGSIQPYLPQTAASALEIVPVGQSRTLSVSWPIWLHSPMERELLNIAKPDFVISHLLGYEGAGSLKSWLVSKGWGNAVQASVSNDVMDLQMFDVAVDLTEEGLKHRTEIISAIFSFIDLLKTGIPAYIYDELVLLSRLGFDYAEKGDPSGYASSLAANMQSFVNPAEYIAGPSLFSNPNPSQVQSYLEALTPKNARINFISPDFKGKTKLVSKYYGTEYNNITLTAETPKWEKAKANDFPEFHLPAANELIPQNFELFSPPPPGLSDKQKRALLDAVPTMIRQDDRWTIWHKVDSTFEQPKAYVAISLAVPSSQYDAKFVVSSRLFSSVFQESINEYLYDARLAGLSFQIAFTSKGVQLIFSGFNDKLLLFVERVCNALKNFEPDAATFSRIKVVLDREFANWKTDQPYSHAAYYASLASETLQYPIPELQAALKSTTLGDVKDFIGKQTKRSSGTALVMGNINQDSALQITNIIEGSFPFDSLPVNERSTRKAGVYPLTGGDNKVKGYRIARPEPNTNDENSAVSFYFQLPSFQPEEYMYVELLADLLEQPFYNSLRTQQQLGYIVYSGVKVRADVFRNLVFVVQSSIVDGAELTSRVEKFIDEEVPTLLETLSEKQFKSFQEGIAVRKLDPDQRLSSQAGRFWSEILVDAGNQVAAAVGMEERVKEGKPMFERRVAEVAALKSIKLSDFKKFTNSFLSINGDKRRLLVSQITSVKGDKDKDTTSVSDKSMLAEISDELTFRDDIVK